MRKTNCVRLLSTFSKTDFKQFNTYLKGLYSGKKDILKLYEYLCKRLLKNSNIELSKEQAHRHLFNDKPIRKLYDTLAELTGLAEEFLLWQHLKWKDGQEKKQFDRSYMLTQIYKKRKSDVLFYKKIEDTQQYLKKQPSVDMSYYLWQFLFAHSYYFFKNTNKAVAKEVLYNASDYLKECYIMVAFYYISEVTTRKKLFNEDLDLETKFLGNTEMLYSKSSKTPHLSVYKSIIDLLENPSKKVFHRTKALIEQQSEVATLEEQEAWYNSLTNYISLRLQEGKLDSYLKELLVVLFCRLTIGLKKEGTITAVFYLNTAYTIARVQQYDPTIISSSWDDDLHAEEIKAYFTNPEQFIEKYKLYVTSNEQENAYKLALATVYFEQKKHKETRQILESVKINGQGFDMNTRTRSLKIKTLVELNQDIQEDCTNFKQYLSRLRENASVGQAKIIGNNNFIQLIEAFYYEKKDTVFLKKRIEEVEFINHKSWLLEKIGAS